MACTDTSFASMFDVKIIEGDKNNFIRDKNSIVLTQSLASKIFGKVSALHKMLALYTDDSTTIYAAVSNVIADLPKTSHLQVEGLLPIPENFGGELADNYGVLLGPTYLQLKPGVDINALDAKLSNTIHAKKSIY
ncbi:MAG: ABC transporter permease [Segetibacter sp.]